MSRLNDIRPTTWLPSLLAALTTWVTMLAWSNFAETPSGFLVPILGGCLLVAIVGMLARGLRTPAVVTALVQVVVVLLWLNHREAASQAIGGWVPTPDSVRVLLGAFNDSVLASQAYAAPVPKSVPEFYPLLILAGTLTAVLVDFLAVGLRRAPLAGLPLLALYTAPVSILDGGVSWLKFALAALSFLFLIAAEEAQRLAHWGHQIVPGGRIFDTQTTEVSSAPIWASARKIGLTATSLAIVVPIFVPTLSTTFFGGGSGPGDGEGDAVSISNPMIDLKRDLTQGPGHHDGQRPVVPPAHRAELLRRHGVAPVDPGHPAQAAGRRRDHPASWPGPHGGDQGGLGHRAGERELQVAVAADALPGGLRGRAR